MLGSAQGVWAVGSCHTRAAALGRSRASPFDSEGSWTAGAVRASPEWVSAVLQPTHTLRWGGGGAATAACAAVQRAALVNLGELATYDQAKQSILASGMVQQEGIATHVGAAVFSGLVATVFSTPAGARGPLGRVRKAARAGTYPNPGGAFDECAGAGRSP